MCGEEIKDLARGLLLCPFAGPATVRWYVCMFVGSGGQMNKRKQLAM